MTDIKELIRKRGSIKGRLTAFANYVNTLKSDLSSVQVSELSLRISKMNEMFAQFDKIQSAIECTVDDTSVAAQHSERQEFESLYYSILGLAQDLYVTNKPKAHGTDDDEDSSSHSYVSGHSQGQPEVKQTKVGNIRGVKLPTIQIPKFNGNYEDWLEFRDTFESLIHNNNTITNIQKYHYLRAALEGGAAQVVRSLEFSSGNYSVAWQLLCDRYNNTRLLIQNHIQALFTLEQIKRESAQAIRCLIDTFTKNLRSLETLGEPTSSWDTLIIYIISSKLDSKTLREWEERKDTKSKITLKQFTTFLKDRADLLETMNMNTSIAQPASSRYRSNIEHVKGLATTTNTHPSCPLCNQTHRIYTCETFLNQSVNERAETVKRLNLCANCLRPGHHARVCRLGPCKKCSKRGHNSLIHIEDSPVDIHATTLSVNVAERVLLSTAVVYIRDKQGQRHEARAVLDSESQASFMTESLQQRLNIKCIKTQTSVVGINNSLSQVTKRCSASIESRINPFIVNISFLVLPNIASLSQYTINIHKLNLSIHIPLADPEYYKPSQVDILLGADIYWDLLGQGQIRLGERSPVLQQTKLGYIVSGPTSGLNHTHNTENTITCNLIQNDNTQIQAQLEKFWSLEETPNRYNIIYSEEERQCEENFVKTFKRLSNGMFSVAIPLKKSQSCLGDSYDRAKQCFLSLERRLQRQPELNQMYTEFMNEYIEMGHMTKIDNHDTNRKHDSHTQIPYFLPHHGVLRDNSTTTKLRVVFNASAPTTTGMSFNQIQMVGPTIQSNLFSILIRFRHYAYVMIGDIEKMYRFVSVQKYYRHLQQIIWRDNPKKELQTYQLNTVTYGTSSAPFLAVRCLKQLALECEDSVISQVISEDFYVDDLVTGCQSIQGLNQIREGIISVLSSAQFNSRKMRSNVRNITSIDLDSCQYLSLGEPSLGRTLGLGWSSASDELYFDIKIDSSRIPTKRTVLSAIGQIFDPMGLLSIVIIQLKIFMQKMWLVKISWDDPLPSDLQTIWQKYVSEVVQLNELRIPRGVVPSDSDVIEIHTFCDSSKDAYGACVYVRTISKNTQIQTNLLCAKSRVAPLKPLTIPRLELCGALVASRLTMEVLQSFRLPVKRCLLWCDSSIVLAWIKTEPNKLNQFVRNRIAEIQDITKEYEWRHVPTSINSADLLTREVNISEIHRLDLWWTGPKFLNYTEDKWPQAQLSQTSEIPEIVSHIALPTDNRDQVINFDRFSKLRRIKRSLAYALRFVHNIKKENTKLTGSLSVAEINKAFNLLLKWSQIQSFKEYELLLYNKSIPNMNRLLSLSPFLDEDGLIRVGGRLANSNFEYTKKHPILISCTHHIARLIFTEEHTRLYHAGPQLLLASIREQYWPLGGRNMARFIAHKCARCCRMRALTPNPIMGQLPKQRLEPGYPFQSTGVDYAGPLIAVDRKGRGCKLIKVYVAVFVCFTTKALHLELITDLTKEAYIAALRRFIARRSKPSIMFSDNGTQFIGAKNEIQRFLAQNSSPISENMAMEGIDFRFIPAYTPHFGGLWEAGVKSFKYHLARVLGEAHLTFEELYTTLVQIEAILNSRPLYPISPDPNDLTPLTPGHFLVGRPLTALPTPKVDDINPLRLQRWERVEQLRQHFWNRWQKEYVSELQQKTKWQSSKGALNKGTLVLIKENHLPPMKWSLGRIQHVICGKDGVGRVADIFTTNGVIRRAFNKICPLPVEEQAQLEIVGSETSNAGGNVNNP